MNYKELFYFSGHCLSLDEHPDFRETIVKKILAEEIPWEKFVQLCSDHLIIPAIYLRFKAHGLLNFLPEELAQTLTVIYELNRERNAKILLQMEQITAALFQEKIIPVFLKGTANMLDGLYSDPGERMIHDIDFLVTEENYLRTAAILKGMGYTHDLSQYFEYQSLKHYPILSKAGEIAPVEIHRMPVELKHSTQLNSKMLFRDKKGVSWKPGFNVPSDRHKLVHTFIHCQLNDKGHAYKQTSFRDFYDLFQLSKRLPVFTLPDHTRFKKEAIAWLVFGQRVLGLPGRFYPFETREAKWFCLKYDLALRYVKIYNAYTFFKKLIYLLFVRYVGGLLKAVFRKRQRVSVYRRLKDPQWYGAHLMSFKEYF